MVKLRKDQSGQILPLVLVLLVLGSLIITPALTYASTTLIAERNSKERNDQLYAADAGFEDAMYKLRKSGNFTLYVPQTQGSFGQTFNITANGKPVEVQIACVENSTGSKVYNITSTATGDKGTQTTVESYVIRQPSFFEYALTCSEPIDHADLSKVEIVGPYNDTYDTDEWPYYTNSTLESYYMSCLGSPAPSANSGNTLTIDADITLGPYLAKSNTGTLSIEGDSESVPTLTLGTVSSPPSFDGTFYVSKYEETHGHTTSRVGGNLDIGTKGDLFILDLNRNAIFVEGNLNIGDRVKIIGSGCLIAEGEIRITPGFTIGDPAANPLDFVFMMSLDDVSGSHASVFMQPSGTFYGSIAGKLDIDLNQGTGLHIELTQLPPGGINFPLYDPSGSGTELNWSVITWNVKRQ